MVTGAASKFVVRDRDLSDADISQLVVAAHDHRVNRRQTIGSRKLRQLVGRMPVREQQHAAWGRP